jgi:hypothetical protein
MADGVISTGAPLTSPDPESSSGQAKRVSFQNIFIKKSDKIRK